MAGVVKYDVPCLVLVHHILPTVAGAILTFSLCRSSLRHSYTWKLVEEIEKGHLSMACKFLTLYFLLKGLKLIA